MSEQQSCLRCGREAGWSESTCVACGTTLLVELRLGSPPADPRVRYGLVKELSAIPGLQADLASELKRPRPLLGTRLTRATAAQVGAVLSRAGLEFEVLPLAAEVGKAAAPRGRRWLRWLAAAVVLGAAAGGGALLWRTSRGEPLPTQAAQAVEELSRLGRVAVQQAAGGTRSLKEAVGSVASLRCERSMGTGFFVGPHTLVTNHHVLCPPGEVMRAVLPSGAEGEVTVLARDELHDLAVLTTTLTGPPLPLADASSAELGGEVAVIGSPKGLDFTVHRGTLSFVGRATGGVGYLQVDAAINPGNSGGPLLDARGRVIGIVSARLVDAAGIGFAVPANYLVAGTPPLWPEGPTSLLTSSWLAFEQRARTSTETPRLGGAGPKIAPPARFDALLVAARWVAQREDRQAPEVEVAVVTTDPGPDSRRWRFRLLHRDEPLCDLLRVRAPAWVRLESRDPNLDPALARELVDRHLDQKLYVGVLRVQWSSCPGAYAHAPMELSLDLPGAPPPYDRLGIKL